MLLEIKIEKEAVYAEVEKLTAYLGGRTVDDAGNSKYEGTAATKYDRELLDTFWIDGCNGFPLSVRRFIAHTLLTPDQLTVKLALPGNAEGEYIPGIRHNTFAFMVNYITSRWLEVVSPAQAERFANMATANLDELRGKIFARIPPKRFNPKP